MRNKASEDLLHYGLRPTNRILLCGPPGTGKTLTAKVLASAMGYKLAYVVFDALVAPYLGETASNLRRVFDFVESGKYVALFDEFDIIGKSRDDPNEHGEIKRLVKQLHADDGRLQGAEHNTGYNQPPPYPRQSCLAQVRRHNLLRHAGCGQEERFVCKIPGRPAQRGGPPPLRAGRSDRRVLCSRCGPNVRGGAAKGPSSGATTRSVRTA